MQHLTWTAALTHTDYVGACMLLAGWCAWVQCNTNGNKNTKEAHCLDTCFVCRCILCLQLSGCAVSTIDARLSGKILNKIDNAFIHPYLQMTTEVAVAWWSQIAKRRSHMLHSAPSLRKPCYSVCRMNDYSYQVDTFFSGVQYANANCKHSV